MFITGRLGQNCPAEGHSRWRVRQCGQALASRRARVRFSQPFRRPALRSGVECRRLPTPDIGRRLRHALRRPLEAAAAHRAICERFRRPPKPSQVHTGAGIWTYFPDRLAYRFVEIRSLEWCRRAGPKTSPPAFLFSGYAPQVVLPIVTVGKH